jgi:hypothetical protein
VRGRRRLAARRKPQRSRPGWSPGGLPSAGQRPAAPVLSQPVLS